MLLASFAYYVVDFDLAIGYEGVCRQSQLARGQMAVSETHPNLSPAVLAFKASVMKLPLG